MKRTRGERALALLLTCTLVVGLFSFAPQLTAGVSAAWADGWKQDEDAWKSYGQNGWTATDGAVPKWSGSNVAADRDGDPATDSMAKPLPLPAQQVPYYQIGQMSGSHSLDMPALVTEEVAYYGVYSPEQLRYAMLNALPVKLMCDLDMGGAGGVAWSAVSFSKKMFIDGGGHTIYNLSGGSLVADFSQPLIVKNLTVSSAVMSGGLFGNTYSNTFISMEDVALEHGFIDAPNHGGGLLNSAYYRSSGSFGRVYADRCHTKNVYVKGGACSGNIFGPISGYVKNCYAIDGTMRTAAHSGAFTSCAGNYIFENCFTNVRAYANSNTGAFVGHVEDSVYTPGGDGVSKFINCYAAGSVEGLTNLGGFAAGAGSYEGNNHYLFENCYSTAMVGMQQNGNYQGGFLGCQEPGATTVIRNCYAAGEVGALGTDLSTPNMGGFVGGQTGGSLTLQNSYYDKQTTAMKEAAGTGGATGLLTRQLMETLPDGCSPADSAWVLTDGAYPQLKVFADNQSYVGQDKKTADAYSKASVCTAMLYPSNLSGDDLAAVDQTDYDTVRSLRFLFPLTNNTLAGTTDGSYDISWGSDGTKCGASGMENADIVALNPADPKKPYDDYAVASLAPGVGMVTVYAERQGTVGQRRLRLVPTSAITMAQDSSSAVTTGTNATIYAVPSGETVTAGSDLANLSWKHMTYDHRAGVFFAAGNNMGQNVQKQELESFAQATPQDFAQVDLGAQPGGTVLITVQKKQDDGSSQQLPVDDSLLALFTGRRAAQPQDIGQYHFTYRWYLSASAVGSANGYLESGKTLTVLPAVTPQYYRNYDQQDATQLSLPQGAVPAGQKALYYKQGDQLAQLPADPTRTGYTFQGLSLLRGGFGEGSAQKVTAATAVDTDWAGDDYTVPVYAIWQANAHQLHVRDLPGGARADIDTQYGANVLEALSAYTPSQEGQTFLGWTTESAGNTVNVGQNDVMGDSDLTVYPVWRADPTVDKQVQNSAHSDKTVVDDELVYTIAVENRQPHSTWSEVEIRDVLPPGLTFCPGSIRLTGPDGVEKPLPDSTYDREKHAIIHYIGQVTGGQAYTLQFRAVVGAQAVDPAHPENADITNTAQATGKDPSGGSQAATDPDGPAGPVEPGDGAPGGGQSGGGQSGGGQSGGSVAVPEGGTQVTPKDPDGKVEKAAKNNTDPDGATQVGDRITYTITVNNRLAGSLWKAVSIRDKLPAGLKLVTDSMQLQLPNGSLVPVPASAYHPDTRIISVYVGDVYGGEKYVFTFDVIAEPEAIGTDIGNTAQAGGGQPSDGGSGGSGQGGSSDGSGGSGGDGSGGSGGSGGGSSGGNGGGGDDMLIPTDLQPGDPYPPYADGDGVPLQPDGTPSTAGTATEDPVYPSPKDQPDSGVLPGDADPQLDKQVENLDHPGGDTHLEDLLEYRVELSNPKPGTLWKNVLIFDYLPAELVLDTHSLTLTGPDQVPVPLADSVYDPDSRTIMVPIAALAGGETYVLTYRASIAVKEERPPQIVNRAEATGEDPDGTPSKVAPTAEAAIRFPVDVPVGTADTGDTAQLLWGALLLSTGGAMTVLWRKYSRHRQ